MPGLAVGAVAGGQVVFCETFGPAETAARSLVTPRTTFAIGSLTKPITATAIARLVAQGRLSWDEPVWRYLPEFRMRDPVAGAEATLRDLLCHRTGLPEHDLVWYGRGPALGDILERLRHLEPTAPFRSRWQYQNLAFAAAAIAAARVTGTTWRTLVARELLGPLNLGRTGFQGDIAVRAERASAAVPHIVSGKVRRKLAPREMADGVDPVGGLVSCLEDLLAFLQLHLSRGSHAGNEVVPQPFIDELHRAQILVEASADEPTMAHGLGFFVTSHRGRKLVMHLGSFDGFQSALSFLPDSDLGCVALSNLGGRNPVPRIATGVLHDLMIGEDPEPWFDKLIPSRSQDQRTAQGAARTKAPPPSSKLGDYAGDYDHPAYGRVMIAHNRLGLSFALNGRVRPLQHLYHDVFTVREDRPNPLADPRVLFGYNLDGAIDRLGIRPGEGSSLVWFLREPKLADGQQGACAD